MALAKWAAASATGVIDADGTLTVSVPLHDDGTLAATLTFTLTADRSLRVQVDNASAAVALSDFQAWSNS